MISENGISPFSSFNSFQGESHLQLAFEEKSVLCQSVILDCTLDLSSQWQREISHSTLYHDVNVIYTLRQYFSPDPSTGNTKYHGHALFGHFFVEYKVTLIGGIPSVREMCFKTVSRMEFSNQSEIIVHMVIISDE